MSLNLRSVDLNLLTVFDAIVEERKLSAVAERLGMTQPAVSNALSRLRLTFDDELFVRSRQGMLPTPRAQELIDPIHSALSTIQDALDPDREFDPTRSERVFKLAVGDFGEMLLMPALMDYLVRIDSGIRVQTYPELDAQSLELARKAQIDFYFDYKIPDDGPLEYCQVAEDVPVVIASSEHPRLGEHLLLEDFVRERHIILTYRHRHRTLLDVLLQERSVERKVLAEVRHHIALPGLVHATDALATVPRQLAEHFAQILPIRVYPLPIECQPFPLYMQWHQSLNRDRAHLWMRNLLLELSGSALGSD